MARKKVIAHYESAGEYLDSVRNTPSHSSWGGDYTGRSDGDKWAGCSYAEAYRLASDGWGEGLKKLTGNMSVLRTNGKGNARVCDYGGDFPIVGRAIAGLPDSMSRRKIADSSRKPIIDIYVSPVMSSAGSADKMITLGAGIADFIDSCEAVGYSVNVTVSMIATANGGLVGSVFPIKKGGQALDLERLVYFIAHPSFLRRLGFRDFTNKFTESELGLGMGRTAAGSDHAGLHEQGAIMFLTNASVVNFISKPEDARAWVESQVKAQRPELMDSLSNAA